MITIALTGERGSGKTTLAEAFQVIEPDSIHLETSILVSEVGDELHKRLDEPIASTDIHGLNKWFRSAPEILKDIAHAEVSVEQVAFQPEDYTSNPVLYDRLTEHLNNLQNDFSLARESITPQNKSKYLPWLQFLGGYFVAKVSESIWYEEIARQLRDTKTTDTKLAIVCGVRYPKDAEIMRREDAYITDVYRPGLESTDAEDPTALQRNLIKPDIKVINNGTVTALKQIPRRILADIRADNLKDTYTAIGPLHSFTETA